MAYWLFKSEPEAFSFADLLAEPDRTTGWDGVRNYQARNFLRDAIKVGDGVLFYHSSAEPPCIAGIAEVVRAGHPDPTAFDPKSNHYDPKSDRPTPTWYQVSIRAVKSDRSPARASSAAGDSGAGRDGAPAQGVPALRSAGDGTGMEGDHGPGGREDQEEEVSRQCSEQWAEIRQERKRRKMARHRAPGDLRGGFDGARRTFMFRRWD